MDEKIISSGIEIFELANKASSKRSAILRASDSLMEWTMKHEELKISLLRFIDVLPNLESSSAVIRVAREYFPQDIAKTIPGFKYALSVPANSPLAYIGAKAVRYQVRAVAKQFILGETPAQSLKSLINLRERGFGFTIDLLGEETLSEAEALEYQDRYLDLINQISNTPFPSTDLQDPYPLNISVKLSALYSQYTTESFENSLEVFLDRLLPILTLAQEKNVCVFLDMEDTSYTDLIIEAYKRVLSSGFGNTGLVLQAYLTRTREDLTSLIDWAKSNGQKTVIRLVKGAYWDTETIDAKEKGWEIPVWQIKENSDQEYEALSKILLDNIEYCYPAFGSHNIRSLCYATCYADSLNIPRDKFELQALYGMAEGIKSAFVQKGYFVREYAPIGELLPGMSYLVRAFIGKYFQ